MHYPKIKVGLAIVGIIIAVICIILVGIDPGDILNEWLQFGLIAIICVPMLWAGIYVRSGH